MTNYTLPRVVSQLRHVDGAPFGTRGGVSVIHNFPADGEYSFRLTFYFHQMGTTIFGQPQARGEQIEVSINGERVAIFPISPGHEAVRRFAHSAHQSESRSAASLGGLHLAFRWTGGRYDFAIEQSLVDINVAGIPGLSTLPHLHDLVVEGPHNATGVF